jgi:hypothetical protein
VQKTETVSGEDVTLATITVEAIEKIELAGKKGRQFNVAFIAASILAAGDAVRGSEDWVRKLHVFSPDGGAAPFDTLIRAANEVNGFKNPKPGEAEPEAPAAG